MQEKPRTFVQGDGSIVPTCPDCGAPKPVSVGSTKSGNNPIEVQCSCGARYPVFPEFRKAYRREVNLPGIYKTSPTGSDQGEILIRNMSMTGAGIFILGEHSVSQGDEVTLSFVLVDENQTVMETEVEIVHQEDQLLGCIFKSLTEEQEEALASFFMFVR